MLAWALLAFAMPAFAQSLPNSSLHRDAADAPVSHPLVLETMTLSDRALLLATDFNRVIAAADAPAAADGETRIDSLLQRALALLGTPYRWGGSSPERGFDCSGLVRYVFRNTLGVELPRVSREMARTGLPIDDRSALSKGDLVFFGRRGRIDHVGIYVGDGQFVHAPSRGKDVTVSRLDRGYWSNRFLSARRIDGI